MLAPLVLPETGFTIDISRCGVTQEQILRLDSLLTNGHREMIAIENGAIKNPDEKRQVTHFTDRIEYGASALFQNVTDFFEGVRSGRIRGAGGRFEHVVINGIGGSALGPQLVQMTINGPYWNEMTNEQRNGSPRIYFLDNTDPAGALDILAVVDLSRTLVITISKSGSTKETKNNVAAFEKFYRDKNLVFSHHAAAITMSGSELDSIAKENGWLKIWPMSESIGGRTSVTAIVGHVPAAAAGIDFSALLAGAKRMDEWTRESDVLCNPSYLLATAWYLLGNGKGDKNMVIIPYSDRLIYLSRYLQQLVMESLGKEKNRDGETVLQGLTVFGNKGGTDAHAYVQQLNDGRNDFFVTFIEVLKDADQLVMDRGLTMGNYLHNFMRGLTDALAKKDRAVITLLVEELNAHSLGMLIALYERAVAFYAELININAFHQPGVQAYKKASDRINELQLTLQEYIANSEGLTGHSTTIAESLSCPDEADEIDGILAKFAVNKQVYGENYVSRNLDGARWQYSIQRAG